MCRFIPGLDPSRMSGMLFPRPPLLARKKTERAKRGGFWAHAARLTTT